MIDTVSNRWALKLKELNPEETASVEVMSYAFQGILHNGITFLTALIFGLIYGNFWDTLLATFALMALRMVSGGFHFNSALVCFLVSAFVFIVIPFIKLEGVEVLVLNIINLILVLLFSPTNIADHIRYSSDKSFIVFKMISVFLVSINFFYLNPIVSVAFFVQACSLIPFRRR